MSEFDPDDPLPPPSRKSPPSRKPVPARNPQRAGDDAGRSLEMAIGREVRSLRRLKRLTVGDLARISGLSIGMLSKIENGVTSPSLTTLQVLGRALSVPVSAFFRRHVDRSEAQHVKAGEHVQVWRAKAPAGKRSSAKGQIGASASGVAVEPSVITLTDESDLFPAPQHGGLEVLFMLEGELDYRHGRRVYALKPGDSLLFEADSPHGPETLVKPPARYLSVISYSQG